MNILPLMFAEFDGRIKREPLRGVVGAASAFAQGHGRSRINGPMTDKDSYENMAVPEVSPSEPELIVAPVVEEAPPQGEVTPPRRPRLRWKLPLALFLLTCASTYLVGGWVYSVCLMTILVWHEAGHYLQARRCGVPVSLPFFIPVPLPPIGTLGAVIGMSSNITNRRALFDIGVTGPLAGLVPTLICCVVGVYLSQPAPLGPNAIQYGDPYLLKLLYRWQFGPLPPGYDVLINPILWAGWVGLLVTALNLIPIGQLDGGHVLYALARTHAHRVATLLLAAAAVAVVFWHYYWWTLMLVLLLIMGPKHPPTRQDDEPLGSWRIVLGWLALAFVPLGFTPNPFKL